MNIKITYPFVQWSLHRQWFVRCKILNNKQTSSGVELVTLARTLAKIQFWMVHSINMSQLTILNQKAMINYFQPKNLRLNSFLSSKVLPANREDLLYIVLNINYHQTSVYVHVRNIDVLNLKHFCFFYKHIIFFLYSQMNHTGSPLLLSIIAHFFVSSVNLRSKKASFYFYYLNKQRIIYNRLIQIQFYQQYKYIIILKLVIREFQLHITLNWNH